MGQARPIRSLALVIEADHDQRALISTLLEETEMQVIECDSAEAALAVLQMKRVAMVFTDVELAGRLNGVELAQILNSKFPDVPVIVTSGNPSDLENLPDTAIYMAQPWRPLDILIFAERALHAA